MLLFRGKSTSFARERSWGKLIYQEIVSFFFFFSSSDSSCLGSGRRHLLQGVQRRKRIVSSKIHSHFKQTGTHHLISHISVVYKDTEQIPKVFKVGEVAWCVTYRASADDSLGLCLGLGQLL